MLTTTLAALGPAQPRFFAGQNHWSPDGEAAAKLGKLLNCEIVVLADRFHHRRWLQGLSDPHAMLNDAMGGKLSRLVEIDTRDAKALASIRSRTTIPVASCECLFGRRDYRPFFELAAMDVAIIDVPWNGFAESVKIAAMADAFDINIAPHNFYAAPGYVIHPGDVRLPLAPEVMALPFAAM